MFGYNNLFAEKCFRATDTTIYQTPTIEVDELKGMPKVIPVTFETVKREAITQRYRVESLPVFLNGNTSINAYTESGSFIGYSYFTIRGFDQRRISIMINGIPQNDAEEHQVYWNELADITSSLENIQVQRGMSTALYGFSEIGGVINLQTIDYFKNRFISASGGYGSFNSKRLSLEYSSGLTKSGFGVYGKVSRINTDGYRYDSWADQWSYFLGIGKLLGKKSVIKFNAYGSPSESHLTYLGVSKYYLAGTITGDRDFDRRYNPLSNPDDREKYFQPHFELTLNLQPSENFFISNTFNYIRRDENFYRYFLTSGGYDFSDFRLNYFYAQDTTSYKPNCYLRNWAGKIIYENGKGYRVVQSDMKVKSVNNGNDFGWFPKVHLKHFSDIGNLIIGGEVRIHNSEHSGEIVQADALPPGTPDNYRYYSYNGDKKTYSVYINEFTNIEKKISGMVGIQFTHHRYSVENNVAGYNFDLTHDLLNYRAGLNYNISDNFRGFLNISVARREPRLSDIYDGSFVKSAPNFRNIDSVNGTYSDPLINYEELKDYELGFAYSRYPLKANINFYWMNYRNEIVGSGQLNSFGNPIAANAGESIHRGMELEFEYDLLTKLFETALEKNRVLTLSGNLTWSENYYKSYIALKSMDEQGNIILNADYSGNKILLNPQLIGNLSLSFYYGKGFNAYVNFQYIGKQYLDNTENEKNNPDARKWWGYIDKVADAYTVLNAGISANIFYLFPSTKLVNLLRSLEVSARINNLLNYMYEPTGGIDNKGAPVWIPAAKRNVFFNVKAVF
ncbi:MAG: TonB-dependent receptor [Bacteroidetes bacterium]|nr:TonB-dependent receptor [Bacteroidota bacterium]